MPPIRSRAKPPILVVKPAKTARPEPKANQRKEIKRRLLKKRRFVKMPMEIS